MIPIATLLLGLAVGAALVFLYARTRARAEYARGRTDAATDTSALRERLAQREAEVARLEEAARLAQAEAREMRDRAEDAKAAHTAAHTRGHAAERRVMQLEETLRERERRLDARAEQLAALGAEVASLKVALSEGEQRLAEQRTLLDQAQAKLADAFKALSSDALAKNNEQFLALARTVLEKQHEQASGDLERRQQAVGELVKPLKESLDRVQQHVQAVEQARTDAYAELRTQVSGLVETQRQLRTETGNLVRALRAPQVRGQWGEVQLRRVVEMAGMLNYCDFEEQVSVSTDGGHLRPDMVVRLPNRRSVVVDAKAPLAAYIDSLEAECDDTRAECLRRHAGHVRDHLKKLGQKAYHDQFVEAPEFVVLFLPGETFFSAALQHDPALIEFGVEHGVILATPTTLIALLKAIAYGWRQEQLAENAQRISELGQEMYERARTLGAHFEAIRTGIERTAEAYNKAVGSFEGRFLVTARRFQELGAGTGDEIPAAAAVTATTRPLTAPEALPLLVEGDGAPAEA